jgi:hypothetical protein
MTTLSTLINDCLGLIGDTAKAVFTEAQIEEWINESIEQLSMYFPRRLKEEISTTNDDRKYMLATETGVSHQVVSVLTVEYPADEDPPVYLQYREYTHPKFWIEDGFYCVVKRFDAFMPDDAPAEGYGSPSEIWISTKPKTGETIRLECYVEHDALSEHGDILTVLPRHEHLINLFVRWKAWSELATSEGMDPDPVQALTATMEVNVGKAERSYLDALKQAQQAESDTGQAHLFMDKWDRIY